uniref:Uncharacterized protein n=1 Tax=Arundo donax TaxID=35708 RepID=A0A0A8ZRJ3_ARUDO
MHRYSSVYNRLEISYMLPQIFELGFITSSIISTENSVHVRNMRLCR